MCIDVVKFLFDHIDFEEFYDEKIPQRIECNLCLKIKVLKIDFSFKSWIYEPCFDSDLWTSKLSCRFNRYFMICPSIKLFCIHLENKIQEEGSLTPRIVLWRVLFPACLGHGASWSSVWLPFCSILHLSFILPPSGQSPFLLWYCLKEKGAPFRPGGPADRAVCCVSFLLSALLEYLSMLHQMKPCRASQLWNICDCPRSDMKVCVWFHSAVKEMGSSLDLGVSTLADEPIYVPFNLCLNHVK